MNNKHSVLGIIWRGMAMGVAEIIPGVSGGTIAFITGIYERLLEAISGVGPKQITAFKEDGVKGVWSSLDGNFILFLVLGMGLGIVAGTFGVSYFLENYPEPLWAFFFGLIIASVLYILGKVEQFNWKMFVLFVIGVLVAYIMTAMYPMTGSENLLYLFMAGMIAICALILPGVSGSFMLLILGVYTVIITTLKNFLSAPSMDGLVTISVFALGCLFGLLTFSKVVSYFFKTYNNGTLSVLAGFMVGSIHKIWPWRNPAILFDKESGQHIEKVDLSKVGEMLHSDNYKVVMDSNVLPSEYFADPKTGLVIIAGLIGFFLVFILSRIDQGKE